jgi:hypothetical protein
MSCLLTTRIVSLVYFVSLVVKHRIKGSALFVDHPNRLLGVLRALGG